MAKVTSDEFLFCGKINIKNYYIVMTIFMMNFVGPLFKVHMR